MIILTDSDAKPHRDPLMSPQWMLDEAAAIMRSRPRMCAPQIVLTDEEHRPRNDSRGDVIVIRSPLCYR